VVVVHVTVVAVHVIQVIVAVRIVSGIGLLNYALWN